MCGSNMGAMGHLSYVGHTGSYMDHMYVSCGSIMGHDHTKWTMAIADPGDSGPTQFNALLNTITN